jgi:hypothetical protein
VAKKVEKPDCLKCVHRGIILGDAHSCCKHPAFGEVTSDPLASLMGVFASKGRVAPVRARAEGIHVEGHPHGVRSGWFNHPYNFDPTWLVSCDGFKAKTAREKGKKSGKKD